MRRPILQVVLTGVVTCVTAQVIVEDSSNLGTPPPPPSDVRDLPGRNQRKGITGGFTVNTASREEVRIFFSTLYRASEGVPMNTSADTATCTPGTNASDFVEAVLRRINWFRAMAGVPSAVTFDASFNQKAQQAALMMSANWQLNHFPPPSWKCYTAGGYDGARHSNLALFTHGANAITAYMQDPGANNTSAGHRRWLLYPQTQIMGTGDVPGANATWVFDGNYGGPRPTTRQSFVSWPPPGHVPFQVVWGRWSFSYPAAGFSNSTVTMLSNNVPLAVNLEAVTNIAGENTLVWIPRGLDPNGDSKWSQPNADTVYSITVSNVGNASPSAFSYQVVVFDPAQPGPGYRVPAISGPASPFTGMSNLYAFTTISNATGYERRHWFFTPATVTDGAETGVSNFNAALFAGDVKASGALSFHLTHNWPDYTDDFLSLNRPVILRTNSFLRWSSRLGWASSNQFAKVQISTNDGTFWQDVYSQVGTGTLGETDFIRRQTDLSAFAGRRALLRFAYIYVNKGQSAYLSGATGYGWYIDDIALTNIYGLSNPVVSDIPTAGSFSFVPPQLGDYCLEVRAKVFGEFALDFGPSLLVTAILSPPSIQISRSQANMALSWPTSAVGFTLEWKSNLLATSWTANAVSPSIVNGQYAVTNSISGGAKFYRLKK